MRIATFDELPRTLDAERALLQISAFGSFTRRSDVSTLRRRASRLSDYVGVFGIDQRRVVGQVIVLRIPYAFPEGPVTLAMPAIVSGPSGKA